MACKPLLQQLLMLPLLLVADSRPGFKIASDEVAVTRQNERKNDQPKSRLTAVGGCTTVAAKVGGGRPRSYL